MPFQLSVFSMSTLHDHIPERMSFQVYCLNPPSDSCEFGPCPNIDVTGIGQQIALGFAATTFAITVLFNTNEVRLAYYSYLANIYSLLISAIISMSKGQLTRNDAVFVVVAIISPGTLYLWIIAFMDLVKRPPRRIKNKIAVHEWKFFVFLSIFSFMFWVIILGLVVSPPNTVVFSQPACSQEYGPSEIFNLSWSVEFLVKAVFATWVLLRSRIYEQKNRSSNDGLNLITWTSHFLRTSKFAGYAGSPPFFASILLIMQLSNIPNSPIMIEGDTRWVFQFLNWWEVQSCLLGAILMLPVVCLMLAPMRTKAYLPLIVLFGVGLAISNPLLGISSLDLVNSACWLLVARIYHVSAGKWFVCLFITITAILNVSMGWYFSVSVLFPQTGWFLLWRVYSFKQSGSIWDTLTQLWSRTIESAPVFKFYLLILAPTLAWAQSIVASNPTNSYSMTFGQIFALSIATLPTSSLAVTCLRNRREILRAIWMTDIRDLDSTGIPMHVCPPNISRGALKFRYLFGGSSRSESPAVHPASGSSETRSQRITNGVA